MESSLVSPLGPLPAGWRLAELKYVVTKIGSGATPRGGESVYLKDRSRFALIRSQNVHDRRFDDSNLTFISDSHACELKGAEVQPGDLLLNITGDGVTFARACVVPRGVLPACVNQHVSIIRLQSGVCLPGYLLAYLTHPEVKGYIESFNAGGSRRAITKGNIESFCVPIPPLAQQERISEILGALDDKIELNRRINQTLEAMARAIFKSWFLDLDPVREGGDFLEASEIGHSWPVRPLSEVLKINPPRSLRAGSLAPYLDMSNMPTHSARVLAWFDREFASGMRFVNGDVLVARITPCLENGKTAFVDFLKNGEIGWGSTEYIVLRSKPPFPLEYAYFLARTEAFRSHAITNMTGTTGRQRVPSACFNAFEVVVPPESLLARFGKFASGVMSAMKQRDEESRTLVDLRDALLPKLLSGEIRVKQAEKMVGEVV